jgi:hypothetical protein
MKKSILPWIFLPALLGAGEISAQKTTELYMPMEVKQAYANGTRNINGAPGKNYFQNQTNYSIRAEFFPQTKILTGTETITFINNSKDSLSRLRFNLFQNLYKKGSARDADTKPENIHDGVEVLSMKVNGVPIDSKLFQFYSTILVAPAPQKIAPMSESLIEIAWKQKMPATVARRQGTYDSTNFFIAYWYPKICVFDDISGWNGVGHQGNAEFYGDFGNFDVQITVPAGYTVWSSGALLNSGEIFPEKYLARIRKATLSDSIIQIITEKDRIENQITKPGDKHTWKYKTVNQTDFAFGLSNQYVWDASSVQAGSHRIPINTAYSIRSETFKSVAEVSQKTVQSFSTKAPGIPFPGAQVSVFQGGPGGMEFPGIINQQDYSNLQEMTMVTSHEIGHAYFPFNVGINEQKYGWMDEGLMTFLGFLAFSDILGDTNMRFLDLLAAKYNESAATEGIDVPTMLVSYSLPDMTYGYVTYLKPTAVLCILYDYLGNEKFMQAIKIFTDRWAGKHPIPFDLFFSFNEAAGEDLGWFWKPWMFEFGSADLAIGEVETTKPESTVNVENKGGYPVPVVLTVKYNDGTEKTIKEPVSIWKSGNKTVSLILPKGEIKELTLNKGMMDTNKEDNSWYLKK